MQIEDLLPFIKEIDRLKAVERQTLIHGGGRPENSAEHSWHLAMAALAFHSFADPRVDLLKALKMALLHDLVEIDAGDTFVYGDHSGKYEKETAAIERILGLLPDDSGAELKALWFEFEERRSPEACFVAALDRFLPMFSNHLNEGHSWRRHGISASQVRQKNEKPIKDALPGLWAAAEKMIQAAVSSGHLQAGE